MFVGDCDAHALQDDCMHYVCITCIGTERILDRHVAGCRSAADMSRDWVKTDPMVHQSCFITESREVPRDFTMFPLPLR